MTRILGGNCTKQGATEVSSPLSRLRPQQPRREPLCRRRRGNRTSGVSLSAVGSLRWQSERSLQGDGDKMTDGTQLCSDSASARSGWSQARRATPLTPEVESASRGSLRSENDKGAREASKATVAHATPSVLAKRALNLLCVRLKRVGYHWCGQCLVPSREVP
jgi:hypothetical protein